MATLTLDIITSLDGFTAAEGWPGLWGMGGPDYVAWLGEDDTDHTLLMGATTYRLFSQFSETGDEDMSELTKRDTVVFSSTLREPLAWANTRLVHDDPVETVEHRTFDGRLQMYEYVPTVVTSPPA